MKDFQETLRQLRELSTISEKAKALLEKMTGKELVDYESIDALVGALMRHYNGELKKKAQAGHSHTWGEVTSKPTIFPTNWDSVSSKPSTFPPSGHTQDWSTITGKPSTFAPSSHNHDERYYTEGEIDTKFKNYPVPIGGILLMYNTSNPAELYSGTTWELIATDKYLRTTTGTPLSYGGSNSFTISKANLPAVKIQLESFSVTTQPHKHKLRTGDGNTGPSIVADYLQLRNGNTQWDVNTEGGGANTGTASPYTQNLGNGTAITVNPAFISIRAWKRLS